MRSGVSGLTSFLWAAAAGLGKDQPNARQKSSGNPLYPTECGKEWENG